MDPKDVVPSDPVLALASTGDPMTRMFWPCLLPLFLLLACGGNTASSSHVDASDVAGLRRASARADGAPTGEMEAAPDAAGVADLDPERPDAFVPPVALCLKDGASGTDTACEDACKKSLGVSCAEFEQAYLKSSNTGGDDAFGKAVALDGDTLVVGAFGEASSATGVGGNQLDNAAPESGAVYVFTRSGSSWSQQAYLKASNAEAGDQFGWSVALDGDTLAVGAAGESGGATGVNGDPLDNSAPGSGAVYIFARSGSSWSQQAYLKASNAEADDTFGGAVALEGHTLVVGAHEEDGSAAGVGGDPLDNAASESGAVYVFTRSGTDWSQSACLKASNAEAGDQFGWSVALDGDTLAVGAFGEASSATGGRNNPLDNSAPRSGAVYVFTRSGTDWSQSAYLKASNAEARDHFGGGMALDGDTLAVGAAGESGGAAGVNGDLLDNSAPGSGAVYIFARSGTGWSQSAYLKASNVDANNYFGLSVSLSENTLAVGAFGEASSPTGVEGDQVDNSFRVSGAVYIFARSGTDWSQSACLKASNAEAGDQFGWSVALGGDTLAIGADGEASSATGVGGNQLDNSMVGSGAVYVRKVAPQASLKRSQGGDGALRFSPPERLCAHPPDNQ